MYSPSGLSAAAVNAEKEQGMIDSFKLKAKHFWSVWEELNEKRADVSRADPALQKEYNELLDRGETIRETVVRLTGLIDSANRAYQGAIDYTSRGIETVVNWGKDTFGLGYLNAIPLIPIAVVGVAVAAMTKWVRDAMMMMEKISLIKKLQSEGMSTAQATEIANRTIRKTPLFSLGGNYLMPVLAMGVIGFLIMRRRR